MTGADDFYRAPSPRVRRVLDPRGTRARRYYRGYVDFVRGAAALMRDARLDDEGDGPVSVLDVGCGSGASSWLLADAGFQVTGADVAPSGFRVPAHARVDFAAASVLALPFATASFDIVASYQMLEHVRQPDAALREMVRVLRPGGLLVVAGPNLLSPLNAARAVVANLAKWTSTQQAPRLPFGNTLPSSLGALARCLVATDMRLLAGGPRFAFRTPDLRPPARGDSDACFLLNPMDIAAWMRTNGMTVIRRSPWNRPAWTASVAGGTWVVARKR